MVKPRSGSEFFTLSDVKDKMGTCEDIHVEPLPDTDVEDRGVSIRSTTEVAIERKTFATVIH